MLYEMVWLRGPYDGIIKKHGTRAMFYIADPRMVMQFPDCPRLYDSTANSGVEDLIIAEQTAQVQTSNEKMQIITEAHAIENHNKTFNNNILNKKPLFLHMVAVLQNCLERDPDTRSTVDDIEQELDKFPPIEKVHATKANDVAKHPAHVSSNGASDNDVTNRNNSTPTLTQQQEAAPHLDELICGGSYAFANINSIKNTLLTPRIALSDTKTEATVFLDKTLELPFERQQKQAFLKTQAQVLVCCEKFLEDCGMQNEHIQAWRERIAMLGAPGSAPRESEGK